jgi:hypothetical protein
MTQVIGTAPRPAYPATMTSALHDELTRLMELQRDLEEHISSLAVLPVDVLKIGTAVLAFAEREEAAFFPLLRLLDPAARAELGGDHQQLADDLQLLEWLVSTTPDSPDVATMADAIVRRMRGHIARDGRLLAQARRIAAL